MELKLSGAYDEDISIHMQVLATNAITWKVESKESRTKPITHIKAYREKIPK